MDFATAMFTYIRAKKGKILIGDLIKTTVGLYWQLINLGNYKPKTAQKIVDYYLA